MFDFQLPSLVHLNDPVPSDPLLLSDPPLLIHQLVEWRDLFEGLVIGGPLCRCAQGLVMERPFAFILIIYQERGSRVREGFLL